MTSPTRLSDEELASLNKSVAMGWWKEADIIPRIMATVAALQTEIAGLKDEDKLLYSIRLAHYWVNGGYPAQGRDVLRNALGAHGEKCGEKYPYDYAGLKERGVLVAREAESLIRKLLSFVDASNWDHDMKKGEVFRAWHEATEQVEQIAMEHQEAIYAAIRPTPSANEPGSGTYDAPGFHDHVDEPVAPSAPGADVREVRGALSRALLDGIKGDGLYITFVRVRMGDSTVQMGMTNPDMIERIADAILSSPEIDVKMRAR